ncbi:flavoprotein [Micromonospora sp. WMMA1363]|uniref:flavoprotein n=1 Tax=Micromonospora sp. WMMA1363 TaxID=3053985 RepID=UPI00259CCB01|nr:flavoprotein [Micromonospora sp. WMMA1363]MDM4720162.1 flavoprotein [Micromonospora sp. WMMA1363]
MAGPHQSSERRGVLYVIACGSPLAQHVGRLVELAQQGGWEVCVVTTPDGAKFVDSAALARQTGYPVRTHYKNPGDPDVLPPADAMIVCPATVNTVNKWAAGIADTLALGLVVEAQGLGVPLVAVPYTNAAMAAHPAFLAGLERLTEWGVTVLFGDHVFPLHPPGAGGRHLHAFPWEVAVAALPDRSPTATAA